MKELYKSLAAFQQEVPAIKKNATGYGYKFADLDEIMKVINPILAKNNLGFTQPIDGTKLKTIVFHTLTGESIEGSADIPQGVQLAKMNEFQVMGSAITYIRRYGLVSTLGLVTDEDADAAGEQVKTKKTIKMEVVDPSGSGQLRTVLENEDDVLALAKSDILKEMRRQGYNDEDTQKAFIGMTIGKDKIETIDEARDVAHALENEA